MLLPNYGFWQTLIKKLPTARQSLAMYTKTAKTDPVLLEVVTQLLAGQYDKVLAHIEEQDHKKLEPVLKWIALEASIYTGDVIRACEWFERVEHTAKTGEQYVIKALFYTYIMMTFSKAKHMLDLANKKLEKDHLLQEEYHYRLRQIQTMQTIINVGG